LNPIADEMTQIWPVKVHTGVRVRMRDGVELMSA
jgi:hypothetical protein